MSNRIGETLIHTGANQAIVSALNAEGVDYLVIGGLAMAWYISDRVADDMDLMVNPTPVNAERVFSALTQLNLAGFNQGSFAKLNVQAPLKQLYYGELLTPRSNGPTFDELSARAINGKLFDLPVRIASIQALIALKELAIAANDEGHDKHVKDLSLLRQAARAEQQS